MTVIGTAAIGGITGFCAGYGYTRFIVGKSQPLDLAAFFGATAVVNILAHHVIKKFVHEKYCRMVQTLAPLGSLYIVHRAAKQLEFKVKNFQYLLGIYAILYFTCDALLPINKKPSLSKVYYE